MLDFLAVNSIQSKCSQCLVNNSGFKPFAQCNACLSFSLHHKFSVALARGCMLSPLHRRIFSISLRSLGLIYRNRLTEEYFGVRKPPGFDTSIVNLAMTVYFI